jgi:GT2 family glycosyltransferase
MDLSIIYVNWNSLAYLRKSIASIYAETQGIEFEIVVIDNASPEEGVESLIELFPAVKIIKSDKNLGFARANNFGCKHARGEFVLLLNPDTELRGPAINILLEGMRSLPDAGIVGGKLLNTDLTVQTAAIQKFPTILNQLVNLEFLRLCWPACPLWDIGPLFVRNGRPVRVQVIPGACMLLRRDVFEKVGMFSDEFFMYGEDLDLNCKVNKLGLSNYYIEDAEIIHHGGKSSSRQIVSNWSTIMKYRAMQRYYDKNRGHFYAWMYRLTMGASAAGRLLLLALAHPFVDRELFRAASSKWTTVLKWAMGRGDLTLAGSER